MRYWLILRKHYVFSNLRGPKDNMGWMEIIQNIPTGLDLKDIDQVLESDDEGKTWKTVYKDGREVQP